MWHANSSNKLVQVVFEPTTSSDRCKLTYITNLE